jgi:AbrB family looped-hinge helix DNA binding protein
MVVTLKVREKGVLILPKALREKAGIDEGSMVVATALEDGIILSPKETDALDKLLGLAKVGRGSPGGTARIRSMRSGIDKELTKNRKDRP